MPSIKRAPNEAELEKLREAFLRAETDIINEIGRLRTLGNIDYHAVAALERVQTILNKLQGDCFEYVPAMIEKQFYVRVPEARRIAESVEKHISGYGNASTLTSTQYSVIDTLVAQLMGEIIEAETTVMSTLRNALIGRPEDDVFRQVGLRTVIRAKAAGRAANINQFVVDMMREGVTAFVDKAGRNWSLYTYGNMACRTTSRQAEIMAVLTADPEQDLYMISKHGTTCPLCAPYEGRVYSKSGNDPDFPPLASAFGKIDPNGPDELTNTYLNIHPNCLHVLLPWTSAGRTPEEIKKIKNFSNPAKNPFSVDPRTKKQIEAYRKKERARAKWLNDYRQWERYKTALGDNIPKTFDTFVRHKRLNDERYKQWKRKYAERTILTDDEKGAIIKYIGSDSYIINEKLRNGIPLNESEKKWTNKLDNALKKMPKYKGLLMRSVYISDDKEIRRYLAQFKIDGIYKPKCYISTTKGHVYNKDARIQIYIENSSKGRDISAINVAEQEVLYERGSEFKVVNIVKNHKTYYILLEEI